MPGAPPGGEAATPIKDVIHFSEIEKYDIPADIEFEYSGADPVAEVRKCFRHCKDRLS